jgi:hypothetical protein
VSPKQRSRLYHWEQEMIDACHDDKRSSPMDQWHLVLDPLYEKFQAWKAGEVSHLQMDKELYEAHSSCQKLYTLFTSKRDFLAYEYEFRPSVVN